MPIAVADDSKTPYPDIAKPFGNVAYYSVSPDIGASAAYNFLANRIKTKYAVLVDDDFVFTDQTRLELLGKYVETGVFDIAAGTVCCKTGRAPREQHFEGKFRWTKNKHGDHLQVEPIGSHRSPAVCDITLNFFLAKTVTLKTVGWERTLKVARHLAFFIRAQRAGIVVGHVPDVKVDHYPVSNPAYKYFRKQRINKYQQRFMDLFNLQSVRGLEKIDRGTR